MHTTTWWLVHAPTLAKPDLLKSDWPVTKSAFRTGAGFASLDSRVRSLYHIIFQAWTRSLFDLRYE